MFQTIFFIIAIAWAIAGVIVYDDNFIYQLSFKEGIESFYRIGPFLLIIVSACGFWLKMF